jgi:predicted RecA/RadA family phage recombinase
MFGQTRDFEKGAYASGVLSANTIATFGSDDDHVTTASGGTSTLLGVIIEGATAAEQEVTIGIDGIYNIIAGTSITRGAPLTSDASGHAVPAVAGQNIVGYAMANASANDLFPVLVEQHLLTNAGGVSGLSYKQVATAIIDATSGMTVAAHGLGVTLPAKAIVTRAYLDIVTPFVSTSNDGTIALSVVGAGDLLVAVDADTLSAQTECIPDGTAAKMIKCTTAKELTATVATHAMTAGKAVLFVEYVLSV